MSTVLVILAHPSLEKSSRNSNMARVAHDVEHVIIRDLYELYPKFFVDVEAESAYLLKADYVIFQHPFYWYSVPALLKQYMDTVFRYGFAYGNGQFQLQGKTLINALTTGGSRDSYQKGGFNRLPIIDYLEPISQMARICKMNYWPPYVLHESGNADTESIKEHINGYKHLLEILTNDRANTHHINEYTYLNDLLIPAP